MKAAGTMVLPLVIMALSSGGVAQAADSIWDLEAVDANGVATDPRAGGDPNDLNNWVTVEGIALNASSEMLADTMWQVYVQGEAPDAGGIAAWHGVWFNPPGWPWPPFPDVQPGDRIRIEALVADHNGKVNINSRHSSDPSMQFDVTVLEAGVGMPAAQLIPDISACDYFDQTRAGGGERYQAQWCQLNDVSIVSGTWAPGETLTISDASGHEIAMLLSGPGDFGDYPMPAGTFNVRAIFDQEDPTAPTTGDYRVWVKGFEGVRFGLTLDYVNPQWGQVQISPEPDDANLPPLDPDDPNAPKYPGGTEVTLTAEGVGQGTFNEWRIYDPNHPGDANYMVTDANNPITIVMEANQEVTAVFKCGSGVAPFLPMALVLMGLAALTRRKG